MFLSALIIWPFGLLHGRKERSVPANVARWVSTAASVLLLVGFVGVLYATGIKQIAGFPASAFGLTPFAIAMLGVLLAGAIVGLVTPVFAFLAWKNGYWSVWGRVHYTVLGVAALAFVWWLNYWNLLGFRC